MAVHRPITALEDQGLVRSELIRQPKRGRPVRLYQLTESADGIFPKSYGRLLLDFLQELGAREGIRRIRDLFETRFRRTLLTQKDRMKGKDLSGRVQTISGILNENNYMAENEKVSNRKFVIKLLNCPISQVAKEYPQACNCEQRFLSELLHARVTRDHHILNGHNYCSYVVRRK
jgi:predicted ArsR family transcriptional regulator